LGESNVKYSRQIEIAAVEVVKKWVANEGIVTDTGIGHGPDFLISYEDGTTAVGEIGWHEDPTVAAAWNALKKRPRHHWCDLPPGAGYWSLMISHRCNINRLERELSSLIAILDDSGIEKLDMYDSFPRNVAANLARSLGIIHLRKVGVDRDEAFYLFEGTGGVVPQDPNEIVPWIDELLVSNDYQDSWKKLLPLQADEKHIFIVGGSRTPFGISELLKKLHESIPYQSPSLPGDITHLWLSGIYRPAISIMWSKKTGWIRGDEL